MDDGADSVIDTESGLVPCVHGKKDGVLREELDAFLECRSDDGWLE